MKKLLFVFAVLPFMFSCGGNTGAKKTEAEKVEVESKVEETVVEEDLPSKIESSVDEIKEETEGALEKVDSLLDEI